MVSMRQLATPPGFTPAGYGLLSVAEFALDADIDGHWRNGVEYQPAFCGDALTTVAECVTGGVAKPAAAQGVTSRGADPFAVYAWLDCSPVGYTPEQWRQRTIDALLNNEARVVERVFATGTVTGGGPVYPHLASDTAVDDGTGLGPPISLQTAASVIVTGAVDVVEAVGALEGALGGCYGGTPVLHVPRSALAHLAAEHQVMRDGPRLRTIGGSLVAAGAGYPGTAPDGSQPADGVVWFYATGAVKVWRGQVETTGANPADYIGRAKNDTVLVAERVYVIGWDCCHYAIPVRLGGAATGDVGSPV